MDDQDPIAFDLDGWTEETAPDGTVIFTRPPADVLGVFSFALPPDIPAPLDDLDALRAGYRTVIAASGAGIVSLDVVVLDGVPSVALLIKVPQPGFGMTYLGTLTVPFRDCSYVVRIQCSEVGMTGVRDAIVFAKHAPTAGPDPLAGWASDPYDPSFVGPALRNRADDPAWDADFPDHPLSRARRHLAAVQASLRIADALKRAPPFRPSR